MKWGWQLNSSNERTKIKVNVPEAALPVQNILKTWFGVHLLANISTTCENPNPYSLKWKIFLNIRLLRNIWLPNQYRALVQETHHLMRPGEVHAFMIDRKRKQLLMYVRWGLGSHLYIYCFGICLPPASETNFGWYETILRFSLVVWFMSVFVMIHFLPHHDPAKILQFLVTSLRPPALLQVKCGEI